MDREPDPPPPPEKPAETWRDLWASLREAFLFTRGRHEIDPKRDLTRMQRFVITYLRVIFLVFRLDVYKRVELHAQALTMKLLLSLVPGVAVTFALLGAFGGGNEQVTVIQQLVRYLAASETLEASLNEYLSTRALQNAQLGALTIVILVFTVMSLLSHVEDTFNTLFGASTSRRLGVRLLSYWALLTLGPLLLLSSVALTAAMRSAVFQSLLDNLGLLGQVAVSLTPLVLTWIAFGFLYLAVPNTRVRLAPALIAAMVAGSLWNVAKFGFAWYASTNVTVQNIYGSLATFPLFILWVYISWVLLLGGAQLCHALQHADTYRPQRAQQRPPTPASLELCACRIMVEIGRDFIAQASPTRIEPVAMSLGLPAEVATQVRELLRDGGFIVETHGEGVVPSRDTSDITVEEILAYLRERAGASIRPYPDPPSLVLEELFATLAVQRHSIAGKTSVRDLATLTPTAAPAGEAGPTPRG